MKIGILGGTGFIGQHIAKYLIERGHDVTIWTRNKNNHSKLTYSSLSNWPPDRSKGVIEMDAIINLAGETINQRWTKEAKRRIMSSRIESTRQLVDLLRKEILKPTKVLINASAVGYYGHSINKIFTEEDAYAHDFLAEVTRTWEVEAEKAAGLGIRVVKARLGVVLGKGEGALPRMLLPYKLFAGGTVGSGKQWISWIHIHDVARLVDHVLENENIEGAINFTSPEPVRMNEFGKAMGRVMKRPHWLPVPAFALQLLLGEMSDLILKGQHVLPAKALDSKFTFKFPNIDDALRDILR
jgi:uncharacterized protein (TIGR01777 family)